MSESMNFRTAFHGFHREDVVHYIEYLNAKHTSELSQLRTELSSQNDDTQLQDQLAAARKEITALEQQLAEQNELIAQLRAELAESPMPLAAEAVPERSREDWDALVEARIQAEFDRDAAIEARIQAETARDEALRQVPRTNAQEELEAYRRAERFERVARERAEQIYHQANGALADATVKVDEAFNQIGALTEQVSRQLEQLQSAVTASRQAFSDASATLYSIRPDNS